MRKALVAMVFIVVIYMVGMNAGAAFPTPTEYTVDLGPSSLCAADYDCDGDQDLVMVCNDYVDNPKSIYYLDNDGAGGFTGHNETRVETPYRLGMEDMNKDTYVDMVLLESGPDLNLMVMTNDGAGNFVQTWNDSISSFLIGPLWVMDLNGDTYMDIAFSASPTMHVYLSDGAGNFSHTTTMILNTTSGYDWYDMNGDGSLDLVTTYSGTKTGGTFISDPAVEVYYLQGDGSLLHSYNYKPTFMASNIAIGQVGTTTGVFILDYETKNIEVFEWNWLGMAHHSSIVNDGSEYDIMNSMKLIDIDGDSNLELLVSRTVNFTSKMRIYSDPYWNNAAKTDYPADAEVNDFIAFHANSDGRLDIAGATGSWIMSGTKVWVSLDDGTTVPEMTGAATSLLSIAALIAIPVVITVIFRRK